jgi:hypothetical protein
MTFQKVAATYFRMVSILKDGQCYLIYYFNPLHDIPFLNKTIHIRYVKVKGETVLSNSSHANLICQ